MNEHDPILEVKSLTVEFKRHAFAKAFRAVDDVSFQLRPGQTLGIVGESGSGKTTIGRAILGLTQITAGQVNFNGRDITTVSGKERRRLAAEMQAIFQDPFSSLNPVRTIGQTIGEGLLNSRIGATEIRQQVASVLQRVGLGSDAADRYPSQFSGGQRQRIAIARALVVSPQLIVCDEPTSALDLSVQAQVLNLLSELQDTLHLSYLFVSHNLSVVRYLSHEIMVLYRGRIMEKGPAQLVYENPGHPYTKTLLDAEPLPDPVAQAKRRALKLQINKTAARAPVTDIGCVFQGRCPFVLDQCRRETPLLKPTAGVSEVACIRSEELARENRLSRNVMLRAV